MAPKTRNATILTGLLTVALAAGCASGQKPTPRELQQARFAYDRAATGPAARVNPEELTEAWKALAEAEDAYQDDPGAERTRDLAYVAERRAEIASVRAMADQQLQAKQDAERQLSLRQAALAASAAERAAEAGRAIERASQQVTAAAQQQGTGQRPSGPGAAPAGLAPGEGIAFRQSPTGGTVVVLFGQTMFPTGSTQVRSAGQQNLRQIADTLKRGQGMIHVRGYTDSVGSDEVNKRISSRRAESVRDFLVAQGVPADRIRAEGLGPAEPIADNTSVEGRAQNRRVEIVTEMAMP